MNKSNVTKGIRKVELHDTKLHQINERVSITLYLIFKTPYILFWVREHFCKVILTEFQQLKGI